MKPSQCVYPQMVRSAQSWVTWAQTVSPKKVPKVRVQSFTRFLATWPPPLHFTQSLKKATLKINFLFTENHTFPLLHSSEYNRTAQNISLKLNVHSKIISILFICGLLAIEWFWSQEPKMNAKHKHGVCFNGPCLKLLEFTSFKSMGNVRQY